MLHPELADLFVRIFHERIEPRFALVVGALEQAGEVRPIPRTSLARIVVSLTAGYMLARFVLRPQSAWNDDAEIATMIDVIVNGLKPR